MIFFSGIRQIGVAATADAYTCSSCLWHHGARCLLGLVRSIYFFLCCYFCIAWDL